jgi:hypothetical protein
MATVVHSMKSDSKGYTRHFLDEPIGSGAAGVLVKGPKMRTIVSVDEDGNEITKDAEFQIVLHGQQVIDVPDEVKELTFEDGSSLKLGSKS